MSDADQWLLPFCVRRWRRWLDPAAARCCQTSHGSTHVNELRFAIDFTLPVGTPVLAARDGVVVAAVGGFRVGRLSESMRAKANYVALRHAQSGSAQPGGLYSRYYHLKSCSVRVGQAVRAGERLGLSGNTGYSGGPHLHFDVTDTLPTDAAQLALALPARGAASSPAEAAQREAMAALAPADLGGANEGAAEASDVDGDGIHLASAAGSFSAAMPPHSAPLRAQVVQR
jgi:murein DD-endopeptidase MepM/ murein hydrolase activator NlpD